MPQEITFRWVKGPDGRWMVAQFGPELFSVRLPGDEFVYSHRDFTVGKSVEKPTDI